MRLAALVLVAAGYFVAGKIGLALAFFHVSASPVWPPTGIAIAALLLLGARMWPAILAGAFLVNITTAGSVATSLGIAAGNTLEALVAAAFVNRVAGGRRVFERPRGVFLFAALAGTASAAVSATIGVSTLTLGGFAERSHYGAIWLTWWLGDVAGALMVAPLLVLWVVGARPRWTGQRALEAGGLLLTLVVVGLVVFTAIGPSALTRKPLAFTTIPILLWAAFRFGPREAVTATALLSAIAVGGTLQGLGPFAVGDPNESLLLLQAFLATVSVMTLAVAAVVTERRRVRHALRESERAYRQMFESNPHPMWIVDRETGRFLAVNDAAVDTYGYSRAELLAMTEGDLDSGRPGSVRHLTRDGRRVDVEITGHAITFAGRPASLVLAYDITDRRRDEEERRGLLEREQTARRQAEEANAAKDTFLATLSHELRTPLTTILGWARMLQDGQLASTQARHALQTIERNVRRQSQLINDLLDISRIVTGKLGLDSYRLDLVPVIEDAVDTLRRDAEARRLQLRTDLEFQAASVWGDPGRLHQVVVNLVSNALKFTPEGGQVDVRLDRLGDHALLTVRDSGKGIAPEALPHIFDRFRQADSSLTRRHGGLGLGLAIVREIVHLHGGTVEAESGGAGQGAAFRVRLPLAGRAGEPPGPHRPADATRLGAAMTGLLGMRVLVVDDDADTLDLLSTTLGPLHAGATVMTARSVLEALECFDRMAPDVVVTDLAMPDNDGYALLREVQARGWARDTTTPVVAMTAHAGAEDRERALAAGFAAYVPKPLELAQLIRLLARTAPVRAERP